MQDPFYTRQKKRKSAGGMLAADAWLDSSLYEFWRGLGRGYRRFQDFMSRFHVSGVRRLFVELLSDAFSFLAIGMVLMTALALPAFDIIARGAFNKAEDYSVVFLDRYGTEIGRRGIRSDDSVALKDMPDFLIKATLATEDRRFYDHFGIDVVGTLRALASNAQGDNSTQGGSSLTQQLAKNLFLSSERTLERKIIEAYLAIWLEWNYSKDQILKLYFDRAYMGGGNFGVTAAAEFYFGKRVQDISLAEAAMLAGMFKAPTRYAPHVDLAAARGRANLVLTNMVASGFLTEGQVTAARRHPAAPVDRAANAKSPDYFLDWAFEEAKATIAASGARATISRSAPPSTQPCRPMPRRPSPRSCAGAGRAIWRRPGRHGGHRHPGRHPRHGGRRRLRQEPVQPRHRLHPPAGLVLQALRLCRGLRDAGPKTHRHHFRPPVCIGDWCPQNYGRSYKGQTTLISAFAASINTVPVTLSIKTGRDPIAALSHRMGLRADYPVTRSLALASPMCRSST